MEITYKFYIGEKGGIIIHNQIGSLQTDEGDEQTDSGADTFF